jgi:DNA-binding transcriptional MerR regulator
LTIDNIISYSNSNMSYPAAYRAYTKANEELLRLIAILRELDVQDVDVNEILQEVHNGHHDVVKKMVEENLDFRSLVDAVNIWIGYHDKMVEEKEDEDICDRYRYEYDRDNEDEGLYDGCDNWGDYCDKIGLDKSND